jgi:predicted dehydrogenase
MVSRQKLRLGIVGGGPGSFIGPVHLAAARLDGEFELVCGAFSRDAERSREAGRALGLSPERCYADYRDMLNRESGRSAEGLQCLVVATPNDTHFEISAAALRRGLHVMCDKPATRTLSEAQELAKIIAAERQVYALTYTYSGYPMVREAREVCASGQLGRIRRVQVEYLQGWLTRPIEKDGNKQAGWRTDPARAGSGCLGDIGVHAFHLLEFIAGHRVDRLRADLSTIVAGRAVDDDFAALLRLDNGAPGVIAASQIAAGEGNGLRIRVHGEQGSLDWSHAAADELTLRWLDRPTEILSSGVGGVGLSAASRAISRLPAAHPEGYIEAMANLYREFAAAVRGEPAAATLPTVADGVRGLQFIAAVERSARKSENWVPVAD